MSHPQPHHYPRRILLAVAARSPQIVTETLYALSQQQTPACVPTEIHIITTQRGAAFVRRLTDRGDGENGGHIRQLCDDYALPLPAFNEEHIHLIEGADGQALDDIRSHDDNTHAADFITRIVQQLTADAASSLIVSLSGGRRTMTFYVGYALSLFGRRQDRLTHVLVEDEYFFQEAFYYPPPRETPVVRQDGSGFDASQVEVTLADIPFVRLRDGLPRRLLEGRTSFSGVVAAAQAELAPPEVELKTTPVSLWCSGQLVAMKPVELAFYAWFLQRRSAGKPPLRWSDNGIGREFLAVYGRLWGMDSGGYERVAQALSAGMTKDYFDSRKSRSNGALKNTLGRQLAQHYLIDASGKRPQTRFGLSLPATAIKLNGINRK